MPSVLSNLAPALVQTFATVLVGYLMARLKLIPIEGIKAMGSFVTTLALPALLLRNMATLDLQHIEWAFFLAVLCGKALLFLVVVVLCLLKSGGTKGGLSDAGMFAIFTTQSNDFAMGLPILTALFAAAHPDYPGLLYVVSPISLLLLNPIGMFLMEYGREDGPTTLVATDADASALTSIQEDKPANPTARYAAPSVVAVGGPPSPSRSSSAGGALAPVLGFGSTGVNSTGTRPAPIFSSSSSPALASPSASASAYPNVDDILNYDSSDTSDWDNTSDTYSSDEDVKEECPHKLAAAAASASFSSSRAAVDGGIPDESDEPQVSRSVPQSLKNVDGTSSPMAMTTMTTRRRRRRARPLGAVSFHGSRRGSLATSTATTAASGPAGVYVAADGMSTVRQMPVPLRISHAAGPDGVAVRVSFCRTFASIFYRVGTTPIVLSSIAGILMNLALDGKIPAIADAFLAALGNTFSAVALFILGANMVGKMALFQDRRKLFLPLLLVAAKSLVLPILIRLFISGFGVDGLSDLTLCAFLSGTFPSAPSTHFFGLQFGARSLELVAPSMVLSTLVAAPIMFISAQMITMTPSAASAAMIVSDSTRVAAGFGFVGSCYCVILFVHNRRWRTVRERLLLQMVLSQIAYCVSVQFCAYQQVSGISEWVRYAAIMASYCGVYFSTVALAVNEIIRQYHGVKAEKAMHRWYILATCLLTVAIVGCLTLFADRSSSTSDLSPTHESTDPHAAFERCWMIYGAAQWTVQFVVTLLCLAATVCGALYVRSGPPPQQQPSSSSSAGGTPPHELDTSILMSASDASIGRGGAGAGGGVDDSRGSVNTGRAITSGPRPTRPYIGRRRSSGGGGGNSLPSSNDLSQSLLAHEEGATTSDHLPVGHRLASPGTGVGTSSRASPQQQNPSNGSGCPYANQPLDSSVRTRPRVMTLCEVESFWLFAIKIQLFLSASSLFLDCALLVWSNDTNGIRIEMMLLSSVLFASMGLYTCGLFGLSRNIVSPLRPVYRWLRRCLKDEGEQSLTREQKAARKAEQQMQKEQEAKAALAAAAAAADVRDPPALSSSSSTTA